MTIRTHYLAVEPPGLQQSASPTGFVQQGDVTMWLTIGVILAGSLAWLFRQLGDINKAILEQNLLLKHAVEHMQKLESRLEESENRFNNYDRRFNKVANIVNQLSRSNDILTNKVETIENFLECARVPYVTESGQEVTRSYRKSVRLDLAHPMYNQLSDIESHGDDSED